MKKRIVSLIVLIVMMMMVIMPTVVSATNDENNLDGNTVDTNTLDGNTVDTNTVDTNTVDGNTVDGNTVDGNTVDGNTVDGNTVDGNTTWDGESDSEPVETNLLTSIEQVKLNRKIRFTGKLYKNRIFGFINDLIGKESGDVVFDEKTQQLAVVTDVVLRKSEGMIGVGFIEEGKKIPTTGYIKFNECKVEEVGKYIVLDFNIEDGATLEIIVDGEVYNVDAGGKVQMSDSGIAINGEVILLDKESDINLVTAGGGVTVDIQNLSVSGTGNVSVYNNKINVNGNASLSVIQNGIAVSGDASFNNTEIGSGSAEITLDEESIVDVNISKASIIGNDITEMINSLVQKIIALIMNIIKSLLGGSLI